MREKADICAGFQESVVDVLFKKTLSAAKKFGLNTVTVGGGVAANSRLREVFKIKFRQEKIRLLMAPLDLCTDNAAMIAASVYIKLMRRVPRPEKLTISPQLSFHLARNSRGGFQTTGVI